MWTTEDTISWLAGLGITVPLFDGAADRREWDLLDRVGVVTPTSGPGLILQGIGDVTGFQLRVRGDQNNPGAAQRLALDADRRILAAPTPVTVGRTRLQWVTRAGGRPTPLSPTPDDGGRSEYTCNYLVSIMNMEVS